MKSEMKAAFDKVMQDHVEEVKSAFEKVKQDHVAEVKSAIEKVKQDHAAYLNLSAARHAASEMLLKHRLDSTKKNLFVDKEETPRSFRKVPWDSRMRELKAYKDLYGHCNVSRTKDHPEYEKLAHFVQKQRAKMKSNLLTDEQVKDLKAVGFNF